MLVQELATVLDPIVLQESSNGIDPQIFLWLGTALMFLGMLTFVGMGWGEQDEKKREVYVITILVPAIAFVWYLAMALGFAVQDFAVPGVDETLTIYWGRYFDWLFTTPLLLIDLALLAGADRSTIGALIGLDVMMIVTGLMGGITGFGVNTDVLGAPAQRLVWWGISTAFMVILLYFLATRLTQRARERSGAARDRFLLLRNLTLVLWTAYPIVWVIGTEGTLEIVPLGIETALFMVLDVTAKVGFGYLLLSSRGALDDIGSRTGAGTESAAAGD